MRVSVCVCARALVQLADALRCCLSVRLRVCVYVSQVAPSALRLRCAPLSYANRSVSRITLSELDRFAIRRDF